jgi:hypothetical protein
MDRHHLRLARLAIILTCLLALSRSVPSLVGGGAWYLLGGSGTSPDGGSATPDTPDASAETEFEHRLGKCCSTQVTCLGGDGHKLCCFECNKPCN